MEKPGATGSFRSMKIEGTGQRDKFLTQRLFDDALRIADAELIVADDAC